MQYKIVEASHSKSLENAINDLMRQGWRPISGICVSPKPETGYQRVSQALVRDRDD